jgi:hypothetical protein
VIYRSTYIGICDRSLNSETSIFLIEHLRNHRNKITTSVWYKINASPETEVEDFDHHVENVPYATILYHPTFLPLFHHSHHVFR